MTPSEFDIEAWCKARGDELEAVVEEAHNLHLASLPPRLNPDRFRVRIRDLPTRSVAYIRVSRPYQGDAVIRAAQHFVAWAERQGLANGPWLGYQWDNPEITSLKDCRYHVAVEAERFTPRGEVSRFQFPPMVVAEVEIRGDLDLELRALQWLYGTWLPRSISRRSSVLRGLDRPTLRGRTSSFTFSCQSSERRLPAEITITTIRFQIIRPDTRGYLIVRGLPFAICRSLAQTPC